MAPHPYKPHLMEVQQGQELVPQIRVEGGLFVRFSPAIALPGPGPALFDAVDEITGIAAKGDPAALLQRGQSFDGGGQLHTVIGGLGLSAGQLLFPAAEAQDRPPAPRAGISRASAVGEQFNLFHDPHTAIPSMYFSNPASLLKAAGAGLKRLFYYNKKNPGNKS